MYAARAVDMARVLDLKKVYERLSSISRESELNAARKKKYVASMIFQLWLYNAPKTVASRSE